jgi:hypothetical protein
METKTGSCHCGVIKYEVDLEHGLENLRKCNCSLCRRKNAIMACVPVENFRLLSGVDKLSTYKWNTGVAEHYFCSNCGIYTHHRRRLNPNEYGFNVACIDGIDPYEPSDVTVFDGRSLSLEPTENIQ